MHYVTHFQMNGVDTKQVACIELHGKPNAATEGSVGVLGIDVDSLLHEVYKCVAVNGSIYTWELLSSGLSIMRATTSGKGVELVQFAYADLKTPNLYVVKIGDLIIDLDGYLYQVDALGSDYCSASYSGVQIIPRKGIDYYTDTEKSQFAHDVEEKVLGDMDTALDAILERQGFFQLEGGNFSEKLESRFNDVERDVDDLNAMFRDNEGYNILLQAYPVGSIYMSVNDIDPGRLFGGAWERIKDRFLLGAGGTYSAGASGGSTAHDHGLENGFAKFGANVGAGFTYIDRNENTTSWKPSHYNNGDLRFSEWGYDSDHNYTIAAGVRLGGKTNDTSALPPYLAVYMWKRVA